MTNSGKAIILTYAPVTEEEKNILQNTEIYKLAINQHGSIYKPDLRIVSDYILLKILPKFPEKVISIRERLRCPSKRVEYFDTEFKGATIISAVQYLYFKGYSEILIVGDNLVNGIEFQNLVKSEIGKIPSNLKMYQYSKGNFNLPIRSIKDFCD